MKLILTYDEILAINRCTGFIDVPAPPKNPKLTFKVDHRLSYIYNDNTVTSSGLTRVKIKLHRFQFLFGGGGWGGFE